MRYCIGLISGTSADGIDAALVDVSGSPRLVGHYSCEFEPSMRRRIHALCQTGEDEIERMGALDHELGECFAKAALALIAKTSVSHHEILAIGSHGQTIRHRPPGVNPHPFSLQIGDPNIIAARTGITTVADFRRRDIALGGQGAPLVPAFHQAAFAHPHINRAIVNIGGIANITWLASGTPILGFDTGPGNTLMDAWIQRHHQCGYDAGGEWASTGKVHPALLEQLMRHPYLNLPVPKSTGREDFHLPWLDQQLAAFGDLAAEDVQASLLGLTATTLANHLHKCPGAAKGGEVYVCGGGAHNSALMARLVQLAPDFEIMTTQNLGIAPDWVEATAFAWLAHQTLSGLPGNLPSVTGARKAVVLGGIYPA